MKNLSFNSKFKLTGLVLALLMVVAPLLTLAQAPPDREAQLREDIRQVRAFMAEYKGYLDEACRGGYCDWGFRTDTAGLAAVNRIVDQAEQALRARNFAEVERLLEKWEQEFDRFDQSVERALQAVDLRYMNEALLRDLVAEIAKWWPDLRTDGFPVDPWIAKWNILLSELRGIQSRWSTNVRQEWLNLFAWETKYQVFEKDLDRAITDFYRE